ncbi:MAG: lysophospholipid acyltransferase family protein [Candidatus Aceula meridiana]|nr:lysophospholipid acyltransferase family protein [Candidatus Aceula meridiana]
MIQYYLYKIGQFWVRRLPIKLAYRIAGCISVFKYYLSAKDRRAVKNNLEVIFPGRKDVSHIARDVFRNFGKYLVDFFRMPGLVDEDYISKNIKVDNLEYLKNALKRNKGVVLLTAHLGNWELGGFVLSKLGYSMIAVALPHKERTVNDLFNAQRETEGMIVVPNNVGIRECIKGLNENKLVALLGDRDFNANGEVLDFFKKQTVIPRGPAAFAVKTGAAIIPGFLVRLEDDTFHLKLEEPIIPSSEGDKDKEIRRLMRKGISIIEENIRAYPSQWFMFQRFWIS